MNSNTCSDDLILNSSHSNNIAHVNDCKVNKNIDLTNGISSNNMFFCHNYCHSPYESVTKLAYVNACGLCSKLNNPDCINFVKRFDIVTFLKPKLDCFDSPSVDVYKFIRKNKIICKRKSGMLVYFSKITQPVTFLYLIEVMTMFRGTSLIT